MKKITFLFLAFFLMAFSWQGKAQFVNEGFEGTFPPAGWAIFNNGTGNDWTLNTSATYANTGSNSAKYAYSAANAADAWLFTGAVTLGAGESVDWSFYTRSRGFVEKLKFTVGTGATVADQTTVLLDILDVDGAYGIQNGVFTATTAGDYYFAFNCYSGANQFELFVDDVLIQTPPTCTDPTSLATANVSTTGVDLSWTDTASASAWEYVVQAAGTGMPMVAGTSVAAVTESVTGLTADTAYEVYVRADCGGGDFSAWVGPVNFYTGYCLPEVTSSGATYVDTFNTTSGITNIANATTGFSTDNYGNYFDTMSVSLAATRSFDFSAEIVGGTAGCAIWVDWNNDLIFDVATENVFENGGYGAGPFTGTITVPMGTADGEYRMRIMIDYSDSIINDDACTFNGTRGEVEDYKIIVNAALFPTCLEPTDLATANITATGVDLSWTDNASASAWEYVVQAAGTGEPMAAGTAVAAVTESVTGLTSNTDYEVYVRTDCGGGDFSIWTGPINFTTLISCPAPTDLAVANITMAGVDLSWVDASASAWEYVVQAAGTGEPMAAGTAVAAVTESVTGLTANTAYEVYVRADCGGGDFSTWTGPVNFMTLCDVFTPDYTQDFAIFTPDCWNEASNGDPATGPTDLGLGSWLAEEFAHGSTSGLGAVNINLYDVGKSDWILSPNFDLSAGGYELKLDVALTSYNSTAADVMGSDDEVQLLYTEDGTTWNNLMTWSVANQPATAGETITITLASTGANVQFGIWATEGTVNDSEDYDFHVDNFVIRTIPACLEPTDLATANVSMTGVDLSWTDNASASAWEYVVQAAGTGTPMAAGTSVAAVTESVTGLTGDTNYEVYVRADCGGGNYSPWVGPVNFYTGYCLPEVTSSGATYVDTFNTTSGITNIANATTGFSTDNYGNYFDTMSVSLAATRSFDFSAEIVGGTAGCAIWVDWNNDLIFDVATENVFQNGGYGSGPFTGTITVPMGTADGEYRMRIMIDYNDSTIDDDACTFNGTRGEVEDYKIIVNAALFPTCLEPTDLASTNITATAVDLSWTDNASASAWEYVVQAAGTGEPMAAGTAAAAVTESATGLTSNTAYEVYVRTDCGGGDFSIWTGPINFTTLISCPAPTDLAVANITMTGADLSWTDNASASAWEYVVQAAGTGEPMAAGTSVAAVTESVTGLTADTAYEVYVRADCGGGDFSAWTGPVDFYTGYCLPEVTSSAATYIDTFSTTNGATNIANATTGFSTDNYGNYFDTMSVSLAPEQSFDFSAEIVGGTAGCAIWVDWNNDFVFDVATENVFQNGGFGSGPFTGTVTVPIGTANGDYRMRIMIDYNDSTIDDDACTFNGTRGEVEDYKITVDNVLSITNASIDSFSMYPNPVKDMLNLKAQNNIDAVHIYNMLGQEVLRSSVRSTQVQLNMSNLPSGAYIVKVKAGEQIGSYKLIKE